MSQSDRLSFLTSLYRNLATPAHTKGAARLQHRRPDVANRGPLAILRHAGDQKHWTARNPATLLGVPADGFFETSRREPLSACQSVRNVHRKAPILGWEKTFPGLTALSSVARSHPCAGAMRQRTAPVRLHVRQGAEVGAPRYLRRKALSARASLRIRSPYGFHASRGCRRQTLSVGRAASALRRFLSSCE